VQVGDRVMKSKVLTSTPAVGTVEKITKEYVVVVWDEVNGHWHYTHKQAKKLEIINDV